MNISSRNSFDENNFVPKLLPLKIIQKLAILKNSSDMTSSGKVRRLKVMLKPFSSTYALSLIEFLTCAHMKNMRGRDQNRWGFGDRGWLNSLVQIGLTYHVTQDNNHDS